jgi:hypothetical protein
MDKGSSHIEMVISFSIFLAVVGFAVWFFFPGNTGVIADSTLSYAITEIEDYIETEFVSYSVVLDKSNTADIVYIELENSGGAIVESNEGEILDSKKLGNQIHFDRSGIRDSDFVIIRFSQDITKTGSLSGVLINYTLSSNKIDFVFSEKKINDLKVRYENEYENLKTEFNLPNRADFEFEIGSSDDSFNIEVGKSVPENSEIFSREKNIKILLNSGEILEGKLRVRIW